MIISVELIIPEIDKGTEREVGLCILLIDASGSMQQTPFQGNPVSKMRLISNAAAKGIFELEQMSMPSDAYICAIKFDHRVEQMFFKTVRELIDEYQDVTTFADYIYGELDKMKGYTDINGALKVAKSFADAFLNKKIDNFQDYTPKEDVIYTREEERKVVPNIRTLIYTDGVQWMNGATAPIKNPFASDEVDILMGAFFGEADGRGCKELRGILSKCPHHDFEQFFLLDSPAKIATLRKLFRMASNTSGFCPLCIPKD